MNDFELEDMRQQMAVLKQKLERQEIVNESLIRRSMKKTVSSISRYYYLSIVICILSIPLAYLGFVVKAGLSIAFWIATCIMLLVSAVGYYYNKSILVDSNSMNLSILEVGKSMAHAKKFDTKWFYFSWIICLPWVGWLIYEGWQKNGGRLLFMVVGFLIGCVMAIKLYSRTQRQYQDIMEQIEDLTADQ